jgi:predicted transposase/invertase (TIGR01784 family)
LIRWFPPCTCRAGNLINKQREGKLIDIEMQLFNKYDIEKRTLFYWSKRYASQLQEGEKYQELKKCVTINILNYSIHPKADWRTGCCF